MLDLRLFAVSPIAFFRRLFLKAFLEGFLVILGGFGGPEMVKKGFFFSLRDRSVSESDFGAILARISVVLGRPEPQSVL